MVIPYIAIQKNLHEKLNALQEKYKVTKEEFKTTPKDKVNRAYRNFARLAGKNLKHILKKFVRYQLKLFLFSFELIFFDNEINISWNFSYFWK